MSYDLQWLYDVHAALQGTLSDYVYVVYQDTTRVSTVFTVARKYVHTFRMTWDGSVLSIALRYCCIAPS
jgi:hypothetical protein